MGIKLFYVFIFLVSLVATGLLWRAVWQCRGLELFIGIVVAIFWMFMEVALAYITAVSVIENDNDIGSWF